MKLEYSNNIDKMFSIFPGEFIDISIPKYGSTTKYFQVGTIKDYEIKDILYPFSFKSFSNNGFIKDLLVVLDFGKNDGKLPWETSKYDARINKLFIFYFIDLLSKLSNKYCITIIDKLITKFKSLVLLKTIYDRDKYFEKCISSMEKIFIDFKVESIAQYPNIELLYFFDHYFTNTYYTSIFTKMRTINNTSTINSFIIMIQNITTVLDIFKYSLVANNTYKTDDISIKNISNIKLNILSNLDNNLTYEMKYQKYKHKYLKLKNNFK